MSSNPAARVLVARLDSAGDVLLAGPAVRAVAAAGAQVTVLCSTRGRPAAQLLPGVHATRVFDAPWILADSPPVRTGDLVRITAALRAARYDEAIVLTSHHQCPLPLALLLRLAGVPRIAAVSEEYPGGLLDLRIRLAEDLHEAERAAAIATAAGYPAADARLAVVGDLPWPAAVSRPDGPYIVVHPGSDASARSIPVPLARGIVKRLRSAGLQVVVTGAGHERAMVRAVTGGRAVDAAGRTSFAELASLLRAAAALIVGNTGPAHLAAAVGTPVVSLWAPTVPASRWAPYGVPHVVLSAQDPPCTGSRARDCADPGHPCLAHVSPADVVTALDSLIGVAA
jgi:ADP-heptose:LPS heptosyltransferase